ncbi:hypothetical protein CROQUDRAFT_10878, partial [Cronartium quercuum f. sp. fusiforme G11]
ALGTDRIQNWMWKTIWPQVKRHAPLLFQCITIIGTIPRDWKTARMVMIPKPQKMDFPQASAHRPIALLNTL